MSGFLNKAVRENRIGEKRLAPEALERLQTFRWKGNVRELRHVVESLVLLSDGDTIGVEDLPPQIVGAGSTDGAIALPELIADGFRLEEHMARHEKALLQVVLHRSGTVKTHAARLLGINKDRMKYLCKKHSL